MSTGDPFLRELVSTVVSCQTSQAPPPASKQRAKKDKAALAAVEPLVQVILHDTVLFPEGGGQPHDTGVFTSADGDLWDVVDVKRFGGHAVHYVRVGERGVDAALKAFTPESLVNASLDEAGLDRRLDHVRSPLLPAQFCDIVDTSALLISIDEHSYLAALAVGGPRHPQPADLILVSDPVARTLLRGNTEGNFCR